jgi:hypothetical protein
MAFTTPNDRIFYACQAVLVINRNTLTGNEDPNSVNSKYLTGVQSIGVNTSTPSSSLLDVGRFQRMYHYYDKQEIEINIDRVIDKDSNFFYNVSDSNYQTGYRESHMFFQENINVQGTEVDSLCLKNYDITLIYGADDLSRVGSDRYTGSDPDGNKCIVATYRNCLLTNISYTIAADGGITESITLFTRSCDMHNDRVTPFTLQDFGTILPAAEESGPTLPNAQSGDTVKGYDIKFRPPSLTRYKDDNGTLRRADTSTSPDSYFSILPDEVELMFDLSNSLNELKITGINSITIGVAIDYTEITDVGRWTGSSTSSESPDSEFGQGIQNLWRYVNLPVAVTASFTGTARQAFPHDMKNGSSLFTRAANFNDVVTYGSTKYLDKPTDPPNPGPTNDPPPRLTDPTAKEYDRIPRTYDWNRVDRPILITANKILSDGNIKYFVWDLGEHNYLTDISTSGGDAGGGNVEVTMSYQNDYSDAVFVKDGVVQDLSSKNEGPY